MKIIFNLGVIIWLLILIHQVNLLREDVNRLKEIHTPKADVVTVTTYTIDPRQTDDTPTITASGFNVGWKNPKKHRVIAISRDLKKRFNFGSYVKLEGCGKYDGVYRVEDLMNKRFKKRIDILINPNDKHTMFAQAKITPL
jgi:3D (Asp-Asp-Asp) domain-containing protein